MWLILNESGTKAVSFTSMLSFSVDASTSVVSSPVEKGSFSNFNKVVSPLAISVTLGIQGDPGELNDVLTTLTTLKDGTDLVALLTPEAFYESLTLESVSINRNSESGFLAVDLKLVEIKQVETHTTTTNLTRSKAKNPSSVTTQNTGQAGTVEVTEADEPFEEHDHAGAR